MQLLALWGLLALAAWVPWLQRDSLAWVAQVLQVSYLLGCGLALMAGVWAWLRGDRWAQAGLAAGTGLAGHARAQRLAVDRSFLVYIAGTTVLVLWQAVLGGLSGYPEPWLPVGERSAWWLLSLTAASQALVLPALWHG